MKNKLNLLNLAGIGSQQPETSISPMQIIVANTFNSKSVTSYDSIRIARFEGDTLTSISGCLNPILKNMVDLINIQNTKEVLLLTAVDNLLKTKEFLQLTAQLDQEIISEDEFEAELNVNEHKYLIKASEDLNELKINYIFDIINKLNREFSTSDISEIFSISIDEVNNYFDKSIKAK